MTGKKLDHSTPNTATADAPASENLIGEFKSLMADAEALLHATEGQHGNEEVIIRGKLTRFRLNN